MRKTLTKKQAQQIIWNKLHEELGFWRVQDTSWLNNLDPEKYTSKQVSKIGQAVAQVLDKLEKLAGKNDV